MRAAAPVEIQFDEDARREFLTGFHKRKLARTDATRKRAIERDKQERLKFRKEQRDALKVRAKENAKEVERAYGATTQDDSDDDESEWEGISGSKDARKEDYEDAQIMASVTVEEDFDPNPHPDAPSAPKSTYITPDAKPKKSKPKANKPRKVKYETKAERQQEKRKQRARHTEKAERAGGKGSRPRKTARRPTGKPGRG